MTKSGSRFFLGEFEEIQERIYEEDNSKSGQESISNTFELIESKEEINADIDEEEASDTSSLRDASVILYHPIDEKDLKDLTKKLKYNQEILQSKLAKYDDYDECIKVLQGGITATKYNYAGDGSKKITLKLSKDMKKLQYKPSEGFRSKITPWKNISFAELQGIAYGGTTATFRKFKKPVMDKLNEERWSRVNILPHFDLRQSLVLTSTLLDHQKNKETKLEEK